MVNNHENTQNGSKSTNYRSKTVTFWTRVRKVLFSERSTEMIDGSGKRKRQLAIELRCKNPWKLYSKLHEEFPRSLIIWGNFTFLRHHLFHFSLFLFVCFCFVPFLPLRALLGSLCSEEVWVQGLCHHTDLAPRPLITSHTRYFGNEAKNFARVWWAHEFAIVTKTTKNNFNCKKVHLFW